MSDRTKQASRAAKWRACYEEQIKVLSSRKLTPAQKIDRFAELVGLADGVRAWAHKEALDGSQTWWLHLWSDGEAEHSLFANLPGCSCPLIERNEKGRFVDDGIPGWWTDIRLTRKGLEPFKRVQMRERFGQL